MFFYFILMIVFVDFIVCASYDEDIQRKNLFEPLVYTGKPFQITEAPYMALYFESAGLVCGASIVHQRFLVFAAHCVKIGTYVKVGTDTQGGGQRYDIERQIVHPMYNANTVDCDIAVIKLFQALDFSSRVRPIKLANRSMSFKAGDMMMTLGFGETETHRPSQRLLKIDIPYVTRRECAKLYRNIARITKNMICAGGREGKDVCDGDSGGPLVYKGVLVGVVSYGYGCGIYPSVYSSVPTLRSFVDAAIKKHNRLGLSTLTMYGGTHGKGLSSESNTKPKVLNKY